MDKQLIFVTLIALAIVLPIVGYGIHIIDRRDKRKNNIGATLSTQKSGNHFLYRFYFRFKAFPFTKAYLERIRRRYEILYPGDEKEITARTARTVLITWVCCFMAAWMLFFRKANLNNLCIGIILIYVINKEIISFMVNRTEIRLLEDMINFLSEVRHNYHVNRMVDDAVQNSMDHLGYEMKVHALKLYEILISNNLKEEVARYNAITHNKYLKMFLSLCVGVIEYSDKKVHGQYLFISNIENLKKEIHIEILKIKKLRYLFSGITFVTIASVVPIDAIKDFGISMMPELDAFYSGTPGILFVAVILVTALTIYLLNHRLKDTKQLLPKDYRYLRKLEKIKFIKRALDNYTEKHYGKMMVLKDTLKRMGERKSPRQLLLQQIIAATFVFLLSLLFVVYIHGSNRNNLLNKVTGIAAFTTVSNVNQQQLIEEVLLSKVNEFKDLKGITKEMVLNKLVNEKIFYNKLIHETISEEVVVRVQGYQKEYFKWYELIFCFASSLIAFYIPYWMILYNKRILQMNMEDEVNQFHSIIYMMMYIDHITVKDLLEELELFAVVFKQSIQECINEYNSGEIEALTKLKERESYPPFKRLVDNLIRCDAMSMDKAFDEIASDRENYHDRRKQENEISIQKRADIAKPLSWIPTGLVMGYLTLPLLLESIKELQEFSEAMQNL
ncbi:MAG: hypothetical protein GX306_06115 [Clostridiales bacterium]|nr:hypothetical protein [Clostridiales bacterium]